MAASVTLTDEHLARLLETAAEVAVAKAFRRIRINLDDDKSIDDFVDGQRFLKDMREGRASAVAGFRGMVLDLVKQGVRALLLAAVVALGATVGIHFQNVVSPPAIVSKPQ